MADVEEDKPGGGGRREKNIKLAKSRTFSEVEEWKKSLRSKFVIV